MVLQSANGLGLQAVGGGDYCLVSMRFPQDTIPKWVGSLNHSDEPFIYLLSRRVPIELEHQIPHLAPATLWFFLSKFSL